MSSKAELQKIETKKFSPEGIQHGIEKLKRRIEEVKKLNPDTTDRGDASVKTVEHNIRDAIREIFGENSAESKAYRNHIIWHQPGSADPRYFEPQDGFKEGILQSVKMLSGLISRLEEIDKDIQGGSYLLGRERPARSSSDQIENICERFHVVVQQLRRRHDNRSTLNVSDEYDAQDLMHALLKLFFNDVRPEEWTPSYAGGSSRMDFLLKGESIVIEVKKTREGLTAKQIGEQLIIDIEKYGAHPDCKALFCFVYDPDGWLGNPQSLENDLSRHGGDFDVDVIVAPKGL